MWRVGQDATLRMTVGALVILDQPADHRGARRAPRLRRRTTRRGSAGGPTTRPRCAPGRPGWTSPIPSPERHLRSLSLAPPGSMRQLLDLVGLLESLPFDPDCSPWDVTLIEGLEEGRAALYLRAHHVLTDGVGGIRLLGAAPRRADVAPSRRHAARSAHSTGGRAAIRTATASRARSRSRSICRRRCGGSSIGVNAARDVSPTETAVRGVQRALDVANSVSRQLMVTGGPLSSRPASRSLFSRFEVISVEGRRRRRARPRGQPERPPRGRRRCRPRALPRRARAAVRRAPPRHADQPAPRPRGRAATGSRRPAWRCRPPSGGPGRSSASSSSGWRRRAGSRRCRWPPRCGHARTPADPAAAARPARPGRLRRLRRDRGARAFAATATSAGR